MRSEVMSLCMCAGACTVEEISALLISLEYRRILICERAMAISDGRDGWGGGWVEFISCLSLRCCDDMIHGCAKLGLIKPRYIRVTLGREREHSRTAVS